MDSTVWLRSSTIIIKQLKNYEFLRHQLGKKIKSEKNKLDRPQNSQNNSNGERGFY